MPGHNKDSAVYMWMISASLPLLLHVHYSALHRMLKGRGRTQKRLLSEIVG